LGEQEPQTAKTSQGLETWLKITFAFYQKITTF